MTDAEHLAEIMLAPTEVASPGDLPKIRHHVSWRGGFVFGDVVAPAWNLHVLGNMGLSRLGRKADQYPTPTLQSVFLPTGRNISEPPICMARNSAVQNPSGISRPVVDQDVRKCLQRDSQIPAFGVR